MNDIVFYICYNVCMFLGVDVSLPRATISFPDGFYWSELDVVQLSGYDLETMGGGVARFYIRDGCQGILPQFCSAIVDNPIILFFVIMFAVFIGVKLLRRLCDA